MAIMRISLEQLLRGQHFHSGLRIAGGLLALALGVYFAAGLSVAAVVASGAICAGVVDMPSPFRHKRRELPAAWIVSSFVYLLIGLLHSSPLLLAPGVVVVAFVIALAACYGNKAIIIGFSGNFALIMALGAHRYAEHDVLIQGLYFTLGGGAYVVYGLAASALLVFRTKRQIFAECSFELARFMRLKAAFYEEGAQLEPLYTQLVRQQSLVVQKQQTAREFLFRDIKADRDLRLAQLFIMQVDFFEHVIATNTDYEVLQSRYSGSDIMLFLRDLVNKTAKDIDNIAFTALRDAQARKSVKYKAEIFAVEHDLERLSHDRHQDIAALSLLNDAFDKIILCTENVTEIRRVQDSPAYVPDSAVSVKLSLFTSASNYSPRVLLRNLTLRSLYFRYAIRVGVATACGLLMAWGFNSFSSDAFSHSYWILMTVFVVLRPNFSLTVQRRTDRIIGSACGSLLAAALLYFSPPALLLALFLFAAQVVIVTFLTLNFRYSSAAASILALIQIHFLNPSVAFAFGERTLDTILGALLAYVCCYIFPSWEYRSIPQLIQVLSRADAQYTRAILGRDVMDEEYRLARKSWLDSMAELAGAFERMLREPKDKRRSVNETGRFITLNYLFGSRMASVRALLARLAERPVDSGPMPRFEEAGEKIARLFAMAEDAGEHPNTVDGRAGQTAGANKPRSEARDFAPAAAGPSSADAAERNAALDSPRAATASRSHSTSLLEGERWEAPDIDPDVLRHMDYSEQNVVMLLLKQLDAALTLASEIQVLRQGFHK
jgi:uncharacterized membrane protein YccC